MSWLQGWTQGWKTTDQRLPSVILSHIKAPGSGLPGAACREGGRGTSPGAARELRKMSCFANDRGHGERRKFFSRFFISPSRPERGPHRGCKDVCMQGW